MDSCFGSDTTLPTATIDERGRLSIPPLVTLFSRRKESRFSASEQKDLHDSALLLLMADWYSAFSL